MAITFEETELHGQVPDLSNRGGWRTVSLRWRRDPLTGHGARLLSGTKLQPASRPELHDLTATPAFCPFCAAHLEQATSPFPTELVPEGRIQRGAAVAVPNVMAYATHSAVGIYDPARHFVDLPDLTPRLVADGIATLVEHTAAVRRADPQAAWSSINANYLPPSGSSLVHPHLQSCHDRVGLTVQRQLVAASRQRGGSYLEELVAIEQGGPRWVGRIGRVAWLTPFAPMGFHEVWGVVSDASDIVGLAGDDVDALGEGLSRVLRVYARWNLASFNFALTGGGPDAATAGWRVLLRVVSRSAPEPYYRSDATYFERLYGEALIDQAPEDVAAGLSAAFAG